MADTTEMQENLSEEGEVAASPAAAVVENAPIVKKRGRPAKVALVKKLPSGRGRGRPRKVPSSPGKSPPVKAHLGRGRPKKIETNGPSTNADDSLLTPLKSKGKIVTRKPPKKAGRPRKVVNENVDDDSDENDAEAQVEEKRPVGRPNTGAVNLNIERTGRGQGRPKKKVPAPVAPVARGSSSASPPRKRGRPAKTASPKGNSPPEKTTPTASGRGRGRPSKKSSPVKASIESESDPNNENGNSPSADSD